MKTKRIVALALTAAMAVSMASTTAFAAQWSKYETKNGTNHGPIVVKENEDYKEYYEGYVVRYLIGKDDGTFDLADDAKLYTYRKGSSHVHNTADPDGANINTKETVADLLNSKDITQTGPETAGLLFKSLKALGGLGGYTFDDEYNCVFMGWSLTNKTHNDAGKMGEENGGRWESADTSADAMELLSDNDDLLKIIEDETIADDGLYAAPIKIYPVFREKTKAEKLQSQVNIANRTKVAKPVGGKEWVYSQKDLDRDYAHVSSPLGESSSSDALKKCNAEMRHSRVYEIKAAVHDDAGNPTYLELKKGAVEKVQIPITSLYQDSDINTDQKINDLIKKGKLKVYHIGADGKSRQVTGIKGTNDGKVEFKCGSFSEFVITKDPNARAQAGEEDGASGGNPATGEASTLPVAMLALAALSATGVVAYKKRKAE